MGNVKKFLGVSRATWGYILLGLAAVLTTLDFLGAFLIAPLVPAAATVPESLGGGAMIGGQFITNKLLFSQKIFFFHVPVAIASFLVFFFTAFYGVRFLMTKDKKYDVRARIATEVTLVFVILTMVTGDLWTRFEWGTWWVWEPRLTTYLIMMLLVIAYFVLRNSIEDEERRATYAAVFGIIAFLDAPISFAVTRLLPPEMSMHPALSGDMGTGRLVPFLLGIFGMLAFAAAMYIFRLREAEAKERIDIVKDALEG